MNWPALVLGGTVLLLLMPGSKRLERGKVFVATFKPPPGVLLAAETLSKVQSILPPGAIVATSDGLLVVTFTAVNDQELTGFDTPLGRFELVSVKKVD